MSFDQFLSILRARKWIALAVLLGVVGLTVAVSLLLPKKYTGTASVVIDAKPDPVSALGLPVSATPGFMATQVDILESERVALRVVRDLKLNENPQVRAQWQEDSKGEGTLDQYLVALLARNLDVKPSRESNVIQVNYKAPDPRFAAGLANAFAQAYVATTLELRVDPARQFSSFFTAQVKDARDALEKAQSRLSSFQQKNGIIANDERFDVENARLNELSSQLVQIQAVASESSSRKAQAGATGDRMQEVLANPLISGLKADLARNEAKLRELNSRLGDNHPQVIELKASNAELRSRLDAETRRVTEGIAVSSTINRQREAQIQRELDAQRAKVLRMKAVRDDGQVMQRDVESAQRTYDGLVQRLNQTSLESQSTQSYVNMLTIAQPPTVPSSPMLLLNTLISVVLGSLLAVATALLLELRDRRVRAPEDAVLALGLPVLGTLPKPGAKRYLTGKRSALAAPQRLGLPTPETEA